MSLEFLLTALIVVLIPGTGVLYTVATGLTRGTLASMTAACGCTLGILPHMAASVLGLAAVLHASATAFQAIKIAGVAYLFYLAWGMWRDSKSAPHIAAQESAPRHVRILLKGFLLNILNPKLSIFFIAFLPQFISLQSTAPIQEMMVLSFIFMAMTLAVFILYGLLAARARHHVLDSPRLMVWLRRAFATAFAGLGFKLVIDR